MEHIKLTEQKISEHYFIPAKTCTSYGREGCCWRISPELGEGHYWIYYHKDLFTINVHDFFFHDDIVLTFDCPECISVSKYDSISGEELTPYRHLQSGIIKTFIGGGVYKCLMHKNIPIRAIGIEILPAYYDHYLEEQYPAETIGLKDAFTYIDQTDNFPEMARLLTQVQSYRGDGISAKLFYEGKVSEAISLVLERHKKALEIEKTPLSKQDRDALIVVAAFINDHYSSDISLEQLSHIACMSISKLKSTFKRMYGTSITEFIQARRMGQAEHLLAATDLTIGQVAQSVGYMSASRFSVLFKKSSGLLPLEFRKLSKK